MITTYPLTGHRPQPIDPGRKLPVGQAGDPRDPDGRAFIAQWQAHVDAGRIGSPCRPTASLREASLRPTAALHEASLRPTAALHEASLRPTASLHEAGEHLSDENREIILANERLMFGLQRTIVD